MKQQMPDRRALVTGLGAAAAAAFTVGATRLQAQAPASGFQPARHDLDRWMDDLPGQHRVFIDSGTAVGGGEALLYANNLFVMNEQAYGLANDQVAIVVCLRHFSTPFAFGDEVWAEYGQVFSNVIQFTDPRTGQAPTVNLFNVEGLGPAVPNVGNTIDAIAARGGQFAVCNFATTFFAGQVAQASGMSQDEAYDLLVASAIPNSRFVSAGVVATTRSQEYGYSLLYAG